MRQTTSVLNNLNIKDSTMKLIPFNKIETLQQLHDRIVLKDNQRTLSFGNNLAARDKFIKKGWLSYEAGAGVAVKVYNCTKYGSAPVKYMCLKFV